MQIKNKSVDTENGEKQTVIMTIGHSTHSLDEFIEILKAHGVQKIVDVRTIPKSRYNPQFNKDSLPSHLGNISYLHMPGLGGLRKPKADLPPTKWKNKSFQGYAQYMLTDEFAQNLETLINLARKERVAIMCAEALPWRCHRSMIADALTARGLRVENIFSKTSVKPHQSSPPEKTLFD